MIWTISYALRNFINPYVVLPGILALGFVLWRRRHQQDLEHRVYFTLFWLYLLVLLSMTVFSGTLYHSVPWAERLQMMPMLLARVNLIPFQFGNFPYPGYIWPDVLLNIGVTVPFGLGVAFFTSFSLKKMFVLALGLGLFFEVGQLVVTLLAASPNRAPDINDVIFNAAGVMVGYGLFQWIKSKHMLRNANGKECSLLRSFLLLLIGAAALTGCKSDSPITTAILPDRDPNALVQMVKTDVLAVYATEADRQAAADVASAIEADVGRICAELETPCDFTVVVQIFSDQDAFDRNVMNPEMRGFVAISGQPYTIQMVSPDRLASHTIVYEDGLSIAVHEYVHLALDEVDLALPAWLDEGAAVYVGPHALYDQACQHAFPFDLIPTFQRLVDSYQEVQAPDLFAFAAVDYIVSAYGMDRLNALLRHPDDLEVILSVSLYEFEDGWNDFMRAEYRNKN